MYRDKSSKVKTLDLKISLEMRVFHLQSKSLWPVTVFLSILYGSWHGLRTPREEIIFTGGYIFRSPRINGQLLRITVRRKYEVDLDR